MKYLQPFLFLLMICGCLFLINSGFTKNNFSPKNNYKDSSFKNYLALGDSYTIGESVADSENYPTQLVNVLAKKGIKINPPEIRAVTGWTTGNLISSLRSEPPQLKKYDLVTLLIGVNNQYQGRTLTEYEIEFNYLLNAAINYAGDKKKIIVISIPDYSVTPFAEGSDKALIAKQINEFNAAAKKITLAAGVSFIDITPTSRRGKKDAEMQAADGLHPSPKQYEAWVKMLLPKAAEILNKKLIFE